MKIPSKNDHKSISTLDSVQNLIETILRMLSHLSESGSDCKTAFLMNFKLTFLLICFDIAKS